MARYKPKTTVGKQLLNLCEVAKTEDGKGWKVTLEGTTGGTLPVLTVDSDAIVEHTQVKLRREAAEGLDAIVRHVDKATEFGRMADQPVNAVLAASLALWARELLAAA